MAITLGNDISGWQGDVNFDVYKNNTQFVIVKASEGVNFKDSKLDRNKSEARRVGLLLGYYHFARPTYGNSPEAEADKFLNSIGDFREGELLCLDFEETFGDAVNWCKKFLDYVSGKLNGYKPLIYMDQSRVSNYNWKPLVDASYGLWIAAYTYDPNNNNFKKGAWPFAAMQQWSNRQGVPGIAGGVDGDVFFGDLETLKKYTYKKPTPPPPPEDPKDKQIRELTQQLEDAKKAVTAAKTEGEQNIALLKKQCQEKIGAIQKDVDELKTIVS